MQAQTPPDPTSGATPPQAPAGAPPREKEKTLEAKLIEGQDMLALGFVEEASKRDPETGDYMMTPNTRTKVFDQVTDWLMKRRHMLGADESESPGIDMMRTLLNQEGPTLPHLLLKRRAGRPTKVEAEAYKAAEAMAKRVAKKKSPPPEDAVLKRMLRTGGRTN